MNDEAVRFEARDLRLSQLLMIAIVWQLFRDLPAVALPITLWLLWRAISPWRGEGSLQVDADGLTIAPLLLRRWFTWRRSWAEIAELELDHLGLEPALRLREHTGRWRRLRLAQLGDLTAILNALRQYRELDDAVVRAGAREAEAVGRRTAEMMIVAVLLVGLLAYFMTSTHGWHPVWGDWREIFLITMSLAVLFAAWRMHGLSRRRPWTQMLLAGSFFGVALSGALILGNRTYTEQAPREEVPVLLRLAETNARDQVWRAVEPSAMPALADFTVGGHWRGYESRLAAGQVYRVRVQRGLFGDVAIPPDAFRDAERVAP